MSIYYDYYPDGGNVQTGGSAAATDSFFFDQNIIWQTRAAFILDQQIFWNTGLLPLRWFRVQGCCRFLNPNPLGGPAGTGGQPAGCAVGPLQTDDKNCAGGVSGKMQSVQNVLARTPKEVCEQLTASGNTWDVCSLKVYSIPASGGATPDQCNVLTEVPFEQIPECMALALHTLGAVQMDMRVKGLDYIQVYEGSGTAYTFGSAPASSPQNVGTPGWNYIGSGTVLTGGSASAVPSWKSELAVPMKMRASLAALEVVFGTVVQTGALPVVPATVGTACGTCTSLPVTIYLHHNLMNGGVLVNFLQRNGLSMPSPLTMRYNRRTGSWIANFHLRGLGDDQTSTESWRFSFEWSCTSLIDGQDFGTPSWKFSVLAVRRNSNAGSDFDTRFMVVFPPDICSTVQNPGFDFSFSLDTHNVFVSTDPDLAITSDLIVLSDNIGLFKSQFWAVNPDLQIRLSHDSSESATQYQDISSIVPQPVVFTFSQ
jgi:hypothetical protein